MKLTPLRVRHDPGGRTVSGQQGVAQGVLGGVVDLAEQGGDADAADGVVRDGQPLGPVRFLGTRHLLLDRA
ncbi:hypothetical protein ACWDXD_27385 [Streptomyces sp. NPDC003314]